MKVVGWLWHLLRGGCLPNGEAVRQASGEFCGREDVFKDDFLRFWIIGGATRCFRCARSLDMTGDDV